MSRTEIEAYVVSALVESDDPPADMDSVMRTLSANGPELTSQAVRDIVADPRSCWVVAIDRVTDETVGMAFGYWFDCPSGRRSRIDDVVVVEDHRGRGLGRQMVSLVLATLAEHRPRTVDLTSAPHRTAALGLYEELGFERRETIPLRLRDGVAPA